MATTGKTTFIVFTQSGEVEISGTMMEEDVNGNRIRIYDGDELVASFLSASGVYKK